MKGYVNEALKVLDQAFKPPAYLGDQSKPRLRINHAIDLLRRSYYILREGQAQHGEDALSNYLLGLVYRFLDIEGRDTDWQHQMRKALDCDPEFLEAIIAVRDRENYMDPFCYPKWEDLRDGKAEFRPSILHTQTKTCRDDLVRYNWSIIPAIVIKYPQTSFRTSLSESTKVNVLVDVEAVPPAMPALMHIVTVIFDDPDDPFWCCSYLNLFPIETELYEVPLHIPADYQPFLGRDTARRFCQEPCRCALFVLDMQNRIVVTRIIHFSTSETKRFHEIDQVLQILGDKRISYLAWKQSVEIHQRSFIRKIQNSAGKTIRIPKRIDADQSDRLWRALIFLVIRKGDRLMLKGTKERSDVSQYGRRNDIFIMHAHADSKWASEIKKWLRRIWPSLHVYQTDPQNTKQEPFYFLTEIMRSRCVIFLATPRSIHRPMVGAELGAAKAKLVVSILADGTTLDDLKKERDNDLFSGIDLNRVVTADDQDNWESLARILTNELQLPLPNRIPEGPILNVADIAESEVKDSDSSFLQEYASRIKISVSGKQTESEAEQLLEQVERKWAKHVEKKGQRIRLEELWSIVPSPQGRLLCMAACIPNEDSTVQLLDYFPALVDGRLLCELNRMIDYTSSVDAEMCRKFEWLLEIVRRKLSTH